MEELLKLKKEIRDLKHYIFWLESELDKKPEVIDWDDLTEIMFTDPVYTSKHNETMAEYSFQNRVG